MSDLREKISTILYDWRDDVINDAAEVDRWADTADATNVVADRILALLPKVPELRWDEYGSLMLGDIEEGINVGEIAPNADGTWRAGTSYKWINWSSPTQEEARAAVEAAVRKALGWGEGSFTSDQGVGTSTSNYCTYLRLAVPWKSAGRKMRYSCGG